MERQRHGDRDRGMDTTLLSPCLWSASGAAGTLPARVWGEGPRGAIPPLVWAGCRRG